MKPLELRIEEKVEKISESGCWVWMGNLTHDGYPYMSVNGRKRYMHRVCFELKHGAPIQDGMTLDHKCRVRCCVNPEHMEPMSLLDNIAKGNYGWRSKMTHCHRGHPLSGDNLYLWNGLRTCLACRKIPSSQKINRRKRKMA